MTTLRLDTLPYDLLSHIATYLMKEDLNTWSTISGIVFARTLHHVMSNNTDITKYNFRNLEWLIVNEFTIKLPTDYPINVDTLHIKMSPGRLYIIPPNIVFGILNLSVDIEGPSHSFIVSDHMLSHITSIIESNQSSLKIVILDIKLANDESIHKLKSSYPSIRFVVNRPYRSELRYDDYHVTGYVRDEMTCYTNIRMDNFSVRTSDPNYEIKIANDGSSIIDLYLDRYEYIININELLLNKPFNVIGRNSSVTVIVSNFNQESVTDLQNLIFSGSFISKQLQFEKIFTCNMACDEVLVKGLFEKFTFVSVRSVETIGNMFAVEETDMIDYFDGMCQLGVKFDINELINTQSIGFLYMKYWIWNNESPIHKIYGHIPEIRRFKRIFGQSLISLNNIPDILYFLENYGTSIFCNKLMIFDFTITQFLDSLPNNCGVLCISDIMSFCHMRFSDVEIHIKSKVNINIMRKYIINEQNQTAITIYNGGNVALSIHVEVFDQNTVLKYVNKITDLITYTKSTQ